MSTVVEWVREPQNRWATCQCGRSGRWLLELLGWPAGRPVCEQCRAEMQMAYDSAVREHEADRCDQVGHEFRPTAGGGMACVCCGVPAPDSGTKQGTA